MDGARLMNAVVASGIPAHEMTAGCNSVWVDFTKGLGAPLGAVLCGSEAFIDEAWRWKQRLGGSMRQAGVCAAACIYALDHNIDRLADDHANAKALARGLAQLPGIAVEDPETNLVFFDTSAQRPDRGRTRIEAPSRGHHAVNDGSLSRTRLHASRRRPGRNRNGTADAACRDLKQRLSVAGRSDFGSRALQAAIKRYEPYREHNPTK